jgi:hypothetical protein
MVKMQPVVLWGVLGTEDMFNGEARAGGQGQEAAGEAVRDMTHVHRLPACGNRAVHCLLLMAVQRMKEIRMLTSGLPTPLLLLMLWASVTSSLTSSSSSRWVVACAGARTARDAGKQGELFLCATQRQCMEHQAARLVRGWSLLIAHV